MTDRMVSAAAFKANFSFSPLPKPGSLTGLASVLPELRACRLPAISVPNAKTSP